MPNLVSRLRAIQARPDYKDIWSRVRVWHDKNHHQIMDRLRSGEVSTSMSGVEYFPYPWDEMEAKDPEMFAMALEAELRQPTG